MKRLLKRKRKEEKWVGFLVKVCVSYLPFNAVFGTERKLLRIMRFSAALKIAVFGGFCWIMGRFFETSACLWRNDVLFWKSDVLFTQFCRIFFRFLPLEFWKRPTKFWKRPTKLSENAQSLKWMSRKRQNGEGKSVCGFSRMKKNLAILAVWY